MSGYGFQPLDFTKSLKDIAIAPSRMRAAQRLALQTSSNPTLAVPVGSPLLPTKRVTSASFAPDLRRSMLLCYCLTSPVNSQETWR
ncbi:hypothetical protein M408DRAFT_332918 [Serendipita vermifera MAFF 305830]|uniref:Uncharacterized protein n=1 Tax=Serendipita vermifera MAFF 305830 TaxID=933852 RepID=A0A0C3AT74_SERVB|nr:hypothetical protein M408DRAFT_332918 [Serendipita vermifera MAFF 305830]